jgi:hypothetical protein
MWLSSSSVCEWELVKSCDGNAMVTELDLNSNNLVGRIPAELSYVRMLGKCQLFAFFSELLGFSLII